MKSILNTLKNRTAELIGSAAMRLGGGSSVAEQRAVNPSEVGSIPTRLVRRWRSPVPCALHELREGRELQIRVGRFDSGVVCMYPVQQQTHQQPQATGYQTHQPVAV